MKKKYIYYPILYILAFFLLDKIFLLDYFQKEFLQTGNVVYYRQRHLLFERMKKAIPKDSRNLAVAFGDSRAYAFSERLLSNENKKKWMVYNFSAPQAPPIYAYYWFEKMIQNKVFPSLVIFTISPEGFTDSLRLVHSPVLRLGVDKEFINKYWELFPEDDRHEYILDKLIALRSVEVDYKLMLSRLKNGELNQYDPSKNAYMAILNLYKGEQLAYTAFVNDIPRLESDSLRMRKLYFSNYKVDKTQFVFTEKLLELAQKNGVTVFVTWPKVYKELRKEYEKEKVKVVWQGELKQLVGKYGMKFYNFNEITKCDLFYDASHQSNLCFKEQINFLVEEYQKVK
ncbi:MAG: DUF1574 domain-containing protein [Leptospiraceae bacterium]|nr:DUF1574 domain-containing protein [Leptospiraceae bacterium]MCP5493545.1 DUF1574 domain-containing protein [Leptospiraceae bacterium]